jgi:hypothetical protein
MAEFQMIVLTNPVAGQEEEFNAWYDAVHLRDVMAVPGIVGARRFRAVSKGDWHYAAIYDLECEDPQAVMAEIQARWKTDRMRGSPAFDESHFIMTIVERIGKP